MRSPLASRVAAAVTASMVLAACGGSPTAGPDTGTATGAAESAPQAVETYERINAMSGQERTDEIKKCAEEEGALAVYSSNSDIDKLTDEFSDLFDVDVSVYRAGSESVLQRLLQEQEAGFRGNDIVETNAIELNVAQDEGLLSPYESELRDTVREEGKAEAWTATRFNAFVVGWNTDLVKPGEEPKTLEELTDPKWKGKLSMELGDVDWMTALHQYYVEQGKSEQEVLDLFTALAANAQMAKGHTVQVELLSAGQFAVAVSSYSHTIDQFAEKGAPVAWKPVEGAPVQPVVVRPNGIGLMKSAANPCAAVAFVDYVLTGGQQVFQDGFRIGATADAAKQIEGLEVIAVPEQEMLENGKKWDDLYAQITSGAK